MDETSIDHHLSMWNPVNRKKSYKKWPFNSKSSCTITKMTAAGFYHVPDPVEKDTARCFYCCRTICGFEEGDDPVEEHLRRTKDCKYAKYGNIKDLQSSLTLFEYSQYEAERKDNYIRYQTQEDIKYQISQKEYLYEDLKENIENIKV
ncbi:baculoviral IAP repeat-containing protein 5-like isoform X2 [Bolinopsis microptera]|uniref:baculoviral IAP repeat-containing protein 5-like isoform X2 n=1 Tax=Bolinopsis microptera TaxID=2820187 RepID=UPI0030797BE0